MHTDGVEGARPGEPDESPASKRLRAQEFLDALSHNQQLIHLIVGDDEDDHCQEWRPQPHQGCFRILDNRTSHRRPHSHHHNSMVVVVNDDNDDSNEDNKNNPAARLTVQVQSVVQGNFTEFRQPLQVLSHLEMPGILVQLGHIQRT